MYIYTLIKQSIQEIIDYIAPKDSFSSFVYTPEVLASLTKSQDTPYPWIHTLYAYKDPAIEALVLHMKQLNDLSVFTLCAKAMAEVCNDIVSEYILQHPSYTVYLVPIPLHKDTYNKRGFNQSKILCEYIVSQSFHTIYTNDLLEKNRNTPQQHTLKRNERLTNLKGVFSYIPLPTLDIKKTIILLIDDVTTTGATLYEAKITLEKYGFCYVEAIAFAH